MKRIFGPFTDIIGHLPSSLLPSKKVEAPEETHALKNVNGHNHYVVIYDTDAPEGEPAVVWKGPIPGGLINGLMQWIKIQTIAMRYRGPSTYEGIITALQGHDEAGRVREGRGRSYSDLVNHGVWSEHNMRERDRLSGSPTNSIRERYQQINEEANRNRQRVAAEVTQRAERLIMEYEQGAIDSPPGHSHEEISHETVDVSRHGDRIERRVIVSESNPESPQQRWARERWNESLAGRAVRMHGFDESGNVDDIELSNERDPDRHNKTRSR